MNRARAQFAPLSIALILACLSGCAPATDEPIDPAHLSGRWELTSGDETEWFDLAADGSFNATIDRNGFIATTLSQGPHVTVQGSWTLQDRTIVFDLVQSSEPTLSGASHAYKILSLTNERMETVNAQGEKRTLLRGR